MSPAVDDVIEFLTSLFDCGLGYSAINTARSALSSTLTVDNKPVGTHPLIVRFMKGVFNLKPTLPKNNVTWDPAILLRFLRSLSPVKLLSLKDLSLKLLALLWVLTGQRSQGLQLIDIRNVTLTKHCVKIRYGDKMKTSRPGFQQKELVIKAYAPDRRLCVVTVLAHFLTRTKQIRNDVTQLFISYQKPHKEVSRDTISRWIKVVMCRAGLDVEIFSPHTVRGASTSAAARAQVPIETILATAGWSKECTFRKYYMKPVNDGGKEFGAKILEKFVS